MLAGLVITVNVVIMARTGIQATRASWDFSSLLGRTCNLDCLYKPPGHRFGMASSYDRTLANADASGYIREENGRYLMVDIQGPGAVVRLWSADPMGKIWIYLDDASEPVIHTEFRRLFLDELPPFVKPFVAVQRREDERCYHWAYIPIPFARSCRIYRDKLSFFQATHVQFPSRTEVEPFSLPLASQHQETMKRLICDLPRVGQPPMGICGDTREITVTAPPDRTVQLVILEGPAIIRAFHLQWPSLDPQTGRMALLTMTWDDETTPSVCVPLSDFFGSGFKTLPLGIADDGMGYCYFPMPYQESAKISVVNENKEPLKLAGRIVFQQNEGFSSPPRTFHAFWRRTLETKPMPTRAFENVTNPICNPQDNYLVADLRGCGHYIATMHHRFGRSEGDEYVFVDGEPPPGSSPGTGNEDYFNMAWGPRTMDSPWAGGKPVLGVSGCFRAHLADAIPFERSLQFTFEVLTGNNARYDYDSVAYWYQEEPHAVFPRMLPAAARRFRTLSRPSEPYYIHIADPNAQGWWLGTPHLPTEGENLQVVSANGPRPEPMDMLNEGPDWSGGMQLCQQAIDPGASFTVKLPPVESDGWHKLTIRWTIGPGYGNIQLRSNCPHHLGFIECYAPVYGAKEVYAGAIQRHRNDNAQLIVEVVSKNKEATGAWVGLDWLLEEPTTQPIINIDMRSVGAELSLWQPCPKLSSQKPEKIAETRKRSFKMPPVEAVVPAMDFDKAGEFLLRVTLYAPTSGLYRLDWRSNVPPPPSIRTNDQDCALDPRRFSSPALAGEQPRRFYVILNAGANELTWRGCYAPGQWVAPVITGAVPNDTEVET